MLVDGATAEVGLKWVVLVGGAAAEVGLKWVVLVGGAATLRKQKSDDRVK